MNGGGMRAGLVVAVGLLVLYLAATGKLGRIPDAWRTLNGQAGSDAGGARPAAGMGTAGNSGGVAAALNPLPPITMPPDLATLLAGQRVLRG